MVIPKNFTLSFFNYKGMLSIFILHGNSLYICMCCLIVHKIRFTYVQGQFITFKPG